MFKLEKLVFVFSNMRLRVRDTKRMHEAPSDGIDLDAMFNVEDPLVEWTREIEERALDAVDGQPNREAKAALTNEGDDASLSSSSPVGDRDRCDINLSIRDDEDDDDADGHRRHSGYSRYSYDAPGSLYEDLRDAPFMKNLVSIFFNLDATFHSHIQAPLHSDSVRASEPVANFGERQSEGLANDFGLGSNVGIQEASRGHNPLSPCSQTRASKQAKPETIDVDVGGATRFSSDSPPCGVDVNRDVCGSDHGTTDTQSIGQSPNHGLKRRMDESLANEVNGGSTSLCDVHGSTKKQKQDNSLRKIKGHCPSQIDSPKKSTESSNTQNLKSTSQSQQPSRPSRSTCSDYFVCRFCQTWKITEYTGQMLHYRNGMLVDEKDAMIANTIHVHSRCIEWAPQIYYENNVIKNLNKEVLRGAQLKCSHCGIKGAALGCYAKSCRRTYHVPCSLSIEGCRWDTENYLMLCPIHYKLKFPKEKTSKHDSKEISETGSWEACWEAPAAGEKKWVLCGSALSVDEKCLLVNFASTCGATVVKSWNPNVTHVIAATDANGAYSRTLKVLMAILKGIWIVKIDWIKACMEVRRPVDEETYEVCLDYNGFLYGPQTGRIRALTNAPKLFVGYNFLLTSDGFTSTYKEDLQDLIVAAGGSVLDTEAQSSDPQAKPGTLLVVYSSDTTTTQDDAYEISCRRAAAEGVGVRMGAQVVAHTWLLDSIATGELKPIGIV